MIQELIHDPIFLSQKAIAATQEDKLIGIDLLDTIEFHKDKCVGMAANMIGKNKNIIVVNDNGKIILMFNPKIISFQGKYTAKETCLSYIGPEKEVIRYKKIKVEYENSAFQKRICTFEDFTAQIIQHEIDHTNGILV